MSIWPGPSRVPLGAGGLYERTCPQHWAMTQNNLGLGASATKREPDARDRGLWLVFGPGRHRLPLGSEVYNEKDQPGTGR